MSTILSGTYLNIPAPSAHTGSYYYAADQGVYYYSDGANWTPGTPTDLAQNGPDVDGIPGINQDAGSGFQIPPYNEVSFSNYVGTHPQHIEFKLKGATVASIDLTWDGDNLTNVYHDI
jgi:hypothetical protein